MPTYHVIGLMSGTSLDGLDISYCAYQLNGQDWSFDVLHTAAIPYSEEWKSRLKTAPALKAKAFWQLHRDYGAWLGTQVKTFIDQHQIDPLLVASHGYTVFHEPTDYYTCQIGEGAALATHSKQNVILDFRSMDVALNGEGAPLVPIGDLALFGLNESTMLVNIGGIANYSLLKDNKVLGADICAANLILNPLAEELGHAYDKNGQLAQAGNIDQDLLDALNKINLDGSLEALSIQSVYEEVLKNTNISIKDQLATCTEHIAISIANKISIVDQAQFSGGGALNTYLLERVAAHTNTTIKPFDSNIIEFKEAIIFGFLCLLRHLEQDNCLASITGADRNNIGGAIYLGK